ncbi:hypothetical protein BKA58DRAFT_406774, partial [Alternaria rosae]|uniref:uncharacterized protein n=1 Tax=Alternaria rosae TaxID=1187941 RepID=UPI001E8DC183
MPALRKSLRESRDFKSQQRSSTTPYASPTGTPSEHVNEKKQRSITEWTEPQPQTLAPSFEEHGFARHGVLENMAPLGVPPKAKDKQRARALDGPAARNSLLGKSLGFGGDEVGSTPEVTPAPELEPDDSERQEEEEMQAAFPILEDDEDDDYEPATKPKKKVKVSKTPVRGKTPVQSKTPVNGKTPTMKIGHTKSASVSASPAVQAVSMSEPVEAATQRIQIAVNDAISKANSNSGKRYVGIALRRAYEQSKIDSDLADAIESVIHRKSTNAQMVRFRMRYDQQSAVNHGASFFSQQPSPRASSEIVPDDSASAVNDYQDRNLLNSTNSATSFSHKALQSALDQNSGQALHPFSSAPALPATADTSTESTPRMPPKSPRKRTATNGTQAQDSAMDVDGGLSTGAPTPAARTPDTGGSDSELSDVNEEIVQKGPPEPVQQCREALWKACLQTAATDRRTAAREDDRIYEMRKAMVDQQPIRKFEQFPPPVSDVRFDDEILETESLTDSQIAVGPPVDSDQPRRAGRVPNHGTKRLREDPSRFSSPQFEPAMSSRPSTPAVGPAPKRVKLTNGQGARTKRS